jgi:hypothetical protein
MENQSVGVRVVVGWLVIVMTAVARPADAQNVTLGGIEGTVTDETGGSMPGVAVTLTSPVLQVPQLSAVTDAEGHYKFADLRVGAYRLQCELQGFRTFVRENLVLSAGFVARVDAVLKLGSVSETVVVSAASPVIDLTTTRGGHTMETALLAKSIPLIGNGSDMTTFTPGTSGQVGARGGNPANLGVSGSGAIPSVAFGQTGSTFLVEDFQNQEAPQAANVLDTDQTDVKTYGQGADVSRPGVVVNVVFKSGGNDFHGTVSDAFFNDSLQGSNVRPGDRNDPTRLALFTSPESVLNYNDAHFNLGGRIVRDKLWFFTSGRDRRNKRSMGGLVYGPGYGPGDGSIPYPTAEQASNVVKLSYQMTSNYQLTGLWWRDWQQDKGGSFNALFGNGTPTNVPLQSSAIYNLYCYLWDVQFRGVPTSRLMFDVKFGRSSYNVVYDLQPGSELLTSTYDRNTQQYTGSSIATGDLRNITAQRRGPTHFYLSTGSVSYLPKKSFGGKHEFKVGFLDRRNNFGTGAPDHPAGNYMLVFDTVAGVPHRPVEIYTLSLPAFASEKLDMQSLYATDSWRVGRRLTFNLGLRFSSQHSYIPQEIQSAGQFVQAASFPQVEISTFNNWAPRAAVAWDPTGTGKTVLKSTYGWFTTEIPNGFGALFNPLTTTVTAYRWHDLNQNNNYDPGEVNLSTTGPDFIDIVGGRAPVRGLDRTFKVPHTVEITASLERELFSGVAARLLYVYKRFVDNYADINVARPYSAFNIPLTRGDPGPDGIVGTADDGPLVTIYDYGAAYGGSQFVIMQRVNRPSGRDDIAQTVEVAVEKRMSNRWSLGASYDLTKQHRWLVGIPTSPNDDYYPLDTTWTFQARANAIYTLPRGFQVGASLIVINGYQGQRTYTFRAVDPLGGPPLVQQTTATLRLEPFGAHTGPAQPYMDVRVGKTITLARKRELLLSVDGINMLNTNVAQAITYASGPTYGQITQIPAPRVFRLGVTATF